MPKRTTQQHYLDQVADRLEQTARRLRAGESASTRWLCHNPWLGYEQGGSPGGLAGVDGWAQDLIDDMGPNEARKDLENVNPVEWGVFVVMARHQLAHGADHAFETELRAVGVDHEENAPSPRTGTGGA